MSYISWHNYGYGICTDDITERSIERLKNLLALAPEFNAQMQKWLAPIVNPAIQAFNSKEQPLRERAVICFPVAEFKAVQPCHQGFPVDALLRLLLQYRPDNP